MFQKLPKTVLTCSLDLYWIYFVQKHTNYYIKVSNFVLNTWLLHFKLTKNWDLLVKLSCKNRSKLFWETIRRVMSAKMASNQLKISQKIDLDSFQGIDYTHYGYIRTTVNIPVLVVLIFSQNFSTNGPYVVLNFCKVSDYIVLIFEKNLTLHAMYFR